MYDRLMTSQTILAAGGRPVRLAIVGLLALVLIAIVALMVVLIRRR